MSVLNRELCVHVHPKVRRLGSTYFYGLEHMNIFKMTFWQRAPKPLLSRPASTIRKLGGYGFAPSLYLWGK